MDKSSLMGQRLALMQAIAVLKDTSSVDLALACVRKMESGLGVNLAV